MKKLFVLSLAAVASVSAFGQVAFVGTTFTENFDGLGTTTTTGVLPNTNGAGAPTALPGLTGWYGQRVSGSGTTTGGTGGASQIARDLIADNGSASSGSLYNMGLTADTDRSLGMLASGTNVMRFGIAIQNTLVGPNNTAADFQVKFDAIEFRKPNSTNSVVNTLAFSWLKVSTFNSADLNASGYTNLAAGNIVSSAPVTTGAPLNPPTVTPVSFTISGVNLAPGEVLWMRWTDTNEAGNDAMLGINNFQAVPEPASMAALGLGLAGIVARRRRK